jgi:hypothetical protein
MRILGKALCRRIVVAPTPRIWPEELTEHDLAEHLRRFDLGLLGAVTISVATAEGN